MQQRDRAVAASVAPARLIAGPVIPPGDKSISHRYALLAAIAEGESRLEHFAPGADCAATLGCLSALGVPIARGDDAVRITGRLSRFDAPAVTLDAANSGSTLRMLAGLLAAQPFTSVIGGDRSLRQRPMARVIEPLVRMGARIEALDGRPPLTIHGGPLRGITYEPAIPSAQVKSSLLLAGLLADGHTEVRERVPTRDHTEIALRQFGAAIEGGPRWCRVTGGSPLRAVHARVPGDLSSAAFLIAAAIALPGSEIVVTDVGVNPTRLGFIDWLRRHGARIELGPVEHWRGEPVADLTARASELRGGSIEAAEVPALIDELPVLAVLGTRMRGGLTVDGAAELRVKECDRIAAIAEGLRRMGASVEERPDGFSIGETPALSGAEIDCRGDHRIAMAFAVAGLLATDETILTDADAVAVSYPGFFDDLDRLVER